jgi:hypothetical protein
MYQKEMKKKLELKNKIKKKNQEMTNRFCEIIQVIIVVC